MRHSLCLEVPLPRLQAPAAYFDIVWLQDIYNASERSIRICALQYRRVINYERAVGVVHSRQG
jgi:hypothetical protein